MKRKSPATFSRRHHPARYHLQSLESRMLMAAGPELWFYCALNMATASNVTVVDGLLDRASAAGYTTMLLDDGKLGFDGVSRPGGFDPNGGYYANIAAIVSHAASKGIKIVTGGYSLGRGDQWVLLKVDENYAEGMRVIGATYTVSADGKSLTFTPQNPTIVNPSFASGSTGWTLDPRVSIDTTTGRTDSASLKISAGTVSHAWGSQNFTVIPHSQYHVSYWIKESSYNSDPLVEVFDNTSGVELESYQGDPTFDYTVADGTWQHYDYVFNSNNATSVKIKLGFWGSTTGTLWFDDLSVTQIALHNLVRNPSSPVKIYRADGTPLTEGVDVSTIVEPGYIPGVSTMTYKDYRTPITPTIPASGSSLHPGDVIKIDYNAAQSVGQGQYAVSMTDPDVQTYYHNETVQLRKMFAPGTGVFLSGYDEIRSGNSSTGDVALGKSAGQLLADSFLATYNNVRSVDPTAPIYVWSDMFDPYHNAVNNYYLWNGNLAPVANDLPKDVTLLNWNLGNLNTSLKYFAGLGNQQIIAGYYDSGDGNATAQTEVAAALGAANVRGLMYTTWTGDYSELEDFAAGAKAKWAAIITPPTITGVYVRGTSWSTGFLNYLASSAKGSSVLGYKIPSGANQLNALPWNNLNQISVTFSENVTVTQAALALTGLNLSSYAIASFSYNSTSHTATWTLANPIAADTLQIRIPATGAGFVADTAGNPLDGEWTDSSSTASGNGTPGGDFLFHLKVLPGDVNQSGMVDGADFDAWFTHLGQSTYDVTQGDLNGDGLVDGGDFDLWFTHLGQTTPNAPAGFSSIAADLAPAATLAATPTLSANAPLAPPSPAQDSQPVIINPKPVIQSSSSIAPNDPLWSRAPSTFAGTNLTGLVDLQSQQLPKKPRSVANAKSLL